MFRKLGISLVVLVSWIAYAGALKGASQSLQKLRLSYEGFVLGERPASLEGFHLLKEAFPGTLRYRKENFVVVLDEKERRVLAIYQEYAALSPQELKKQVGHLMGLFGEPTFEAHEYMLFWYFTPEGKMSREEFRRLREEGQNPELLAIAKFYCERRIVEFGKSEKGKARAYFTLYAPGLIKKFVKYQ